VSNAFIQRVPSRASAFGILTRAGAWRNDAGGRVIDETGLAGLYGFELKERVNTPEAFTQYVAPAFLR